MIRKFDRLDESIGGMACNAECRRNILESLMMVAVDFDDWLSQHICNMRTFFDLHFMHKHRPHVAGVGMIERVRELVWEVSVERPTQSNVDELTAAADAKEGFAI